MYSLWLTTCADTRCPWVGRATSDLLVFIQAFGSCAAFLPPSLLLFIMWWLVTKFHISGQVGDRVYVHVCARLPVCLLSLLAMVSCNLLYLSCFEHMVHFSLLFFFIFFLRVTFSGFENISFYILQIIKLWSRWYLHLLSLKKKARAKKLILGFPPFNLFIPTILYATLA